MDRAPKPRILASSTPTGFLEHVLKERSYPTTVLICASRQDFLNAAVSEIHDSTLPDRPTGHESASPPPPPPPQQPTDPAKPHHDTTTTTAAAPQDKRILLKATLAQISTARHIHTVFIPTVAHLRAYLSVFPSSGGQKRKPVVRPPPVLHPESQPQPKPQPALLVYGFLDVHRDGSEWSAQGIGCSAACLVEAAARSGLEAALMEPTGWAAAQEEEDGDDQGLDGWKVYGEQIPLLSTTALVGEDGTWGGVPCTSARIILTRWFTFDDA